MDSSSTYLFRGLDEGQLKKILAVGKEMSLPSGGFARNDVEEKMTMTSCFACGNPDAILLTNRGISIIECQ